VYPKVSGLVARSENCNWYSQLSATRCCCIAVLLVTLVNFAGITPCVAFQRVFTLVSLYFVIDSVRKISIHSHNISRGHCCGGLRSTKNSRLRAVISTRTLLASVCFFVVRCKRNGMGEQRASSVATPPWIVNHRQCFQLSFPYYICYGVWNPKKMLVIHTDLYSHGFRWGKLMLRRWITKEVKNIVVLFNTCSFRKYNKLNLTYEEYR